MHAIYCLLEFRLRSNAYIKVIKRIVLLFYARYLLFTWISITFTSLYQRYKTYRVTVLCTLFTVYLNVDYVHKLIPTL